MTVKEAVVLIPYLGLGHLTMMVELAKLFTRHNLSVTIVLIESPFPTPSCTESFIDRVSSDHPLISFHRLPKPQLPTPSPTNLVSLIFDFFLHSNPLLLDFLQTLSRAANIRAVVLSLFCTTPLDVAKELRIPTYFYSVAASCLATFLYNPTLQSQLDASFKDLGGRLLDIPGLPPLPASHMPDALQDREDEANKVCIYHFERIPKADGIIIDTFEELEPRAVRALADGLCVPGEKTPPVYCVGPLIAGQSSEGSGEKHECLKWLDGQPKGSVVFLGFGSMGIFSAQQLREMAVGLERSEQRFLWVVRSPPSDDPAKTFDHGHMPDPDLSELMPEGFLERTEGRGMVVRSWAPQAAVLAHESVGGFVCHCGWNSILEGVSAALPMITWPLYADQKMTSVFLVEEAKLAVTMEGYDKEMVRAEEVETKVRWLMQSEGGRELRDRVAAMRVHAAAAREDGGPSDKAWSELLSVLRIGRPSLECANGIQSAVISNVQPASCGQQVGQLAE